MPTYRLAAALSTAAILGATACIPPPPPPPITGVSSRQASFNATFTGYDSSGIIAYHCIANVPFTIALTDANGTEYGTVTQATATSSMNLYGGAPCNPFFWTVHVWMECTPDCGNPQGLWLGAQPGRTFMPFKREPGLSQVVVHIDATYGSTPAQGERLWISPQIQCGANPTNGVRTCLFPT